MLIGTVFDYPTLQNQFVFYDPQSGNYTFGSVYGNGTYCGASPHAVYDPIAQYYYTLCCQGDITGCLDAAFNAFYVPTGEKVDYLDLSWEKQPQFGFYF
jgi:hypothetical protein